LSRADLLRIIWDCVDEENAVFRIKGSRKKTGVQQIAPITDPVWEVLDAIRAEQKRHKIQNISGLIFTDRKGKPIGGDRVDWARRAAMKAAKITDWACMMPGITR
jgi:integrase